MKKIILEHTYEGPYELLGVDENGTASFSSVQSIDNSILPSNLLPNFEVNTIEWTVDKKGILNGKAKFISLETHDIVNAVLEGNSPVPPEGQNYREAFVNVIFVGGTRQLKYASGNGQVEARLYTNGLSRGIIKGDISISNSPDDKSNEIFPPHKGDAF